MTLRLVHDPVGDTYDFTTQAPGLAPPPLQALDMGDGRPYAWAGGSPAGNFLRIAPASLYMPPPVLLAPASALTSSLTYDFATDVMRVALVPEAATRLDFAAVDEARINGGLAFTFCWGSADLLEAVLFHQASNVWRVPRDKFRPDIGA